MTHFPLFFDLENKDILIFGGGAFALQRIHKLLPFSPRITVISETISEEIKSIRQIQYMERKFSPKDLNIAPVFVIIAEEEELTAQIYEECNKRHIPVNAVDMPKYCDIIFPSVLATDHLCVGISSGGISPTATVELKEQVGALIPTNIDEILEWMPHAKAYVKKNVMKEKQNQVLRIIFKQALIVNGSLEETELERIITATI